MTDALFLHSPNGDPCYNLAVEEYLLENLPENRIVVFVWQSDNAVVIGRHQNPWREIDMGFMLHNGVALARRISGGGAVYQDRGNLNFSFITARKDFDADRQLGIVRDAVMSLGIELTVNGRKDLLAGGWKVSGSAYALRRRGGLHHGTILVGTDPEKMRSLRSKLRITHAQGISSERSEVTNLASVNPGITVEMMTGALLQKCGEEYGTVFREMSTGDIRPDTGLHALESKHHSWDWLYGATPEFRAEFRGKEGGIGIRVTGGRVGLVESLAEEGVILDAGGLVRFHSGDVLEMLSRPDIPLERLPADCVF